MTLAEIAKELESKTLPLMNDLLDAGHDVTAHQQLTAEHIAVLIVAAQNAPSKNMKHGNKYTTDRSARTGTTTYTCVGCDRSSRSEHWAALHECDFSAEKVKLQNKSDAEDAARYRALRDADMNTRNRLEHYADSALDIAIDTLMKDKK